MNLDSVLAEAARGINRQTTLEDTLDAIVCAAAYSLPGMDHVGISVASRDGSIETLAATDQLVWELDHLQYALNEGPCVHAIQAEPAVIVENLAHDHRWPRYTAAAAQRGVLSQMGLQLYLEEETLGALNMYSTTTATVDPGLRDAADLFAQYAALAMGRVRREVQLQHALRARKTIGQALGLIMERYKIDEARAFAFLTRASQTSNIKLRTIAKELVDQANAAADQKTGRDLR